MEQPLLNNHVPIWLQWDRSQITDTLARQIPHPSTFSVRKHILVRRGRLIQLRQITGNVAIPRKDLSNPGREITIAYERNGRIRAERDAQEKRQRQQEMERSDIYWA